MISGEEREESKVRIETWRLAKLSARVRILRLGGLRFLQQVLSPLHPNLQIFGFFYGVKGRFGNQWRHKINFVVFQNQWAFSVKFTFFSMSFCGKCVCDVRVCRPFWGVRCAIALLHTFCSKMARICHLLFYNFLLTF